MPIRLRTLLLLFAAFAAPASAEDLLLKNLIMLDANPLQDIRNTSRINAVILRGRLLDRAALDAMLAKERQATRPGIP